MESLMMNIMYEIPSRKDVTDVIITADCVNNKAPAEYVLKDVIDIDKIGTNISGELN